MNLEILDCIPNVQFLNKKSNQTLAEGHAIVVKQFAYRYANLKINK